jgi:hypothetical protein
MNLGLDPPSVEEAASLLVAASAIEVETDRGDQLELWTISHDGALVSASGPRLAVAQGMRLHHRIVTAAGPVTVVGIIEQAEYRSAARAAIWIRITEVLMERDRRRRFQRFPLAAPATLRAQICDRIVPGEVIAVTVVDMSETGLGVKTSDDRFRVGDRLSFSVRFFEGEIVTEIRVARVSSDRHVVTVGCMFLDPGVIASILGPVLIRLHGRGIAAPGT